MNLQADPLVAKVNEVETDGGVELRSNPFIGNRRLPCLEGWRGFAILLVLGNHCRNAEGFPANWLQVSGFLIDGLGVRTFMVISGFLITISMMRQSQFSLKTFWINRSLKILPLYFVFLTVLVFLQSVSSLKITTGEWVRLLSFTYNHGELHWTIGHIWSLCVQEQFYVLWTILFVFCGSRFTALATLASLLILIRSIAYFTHSELTQNFLHQFSKMDSLAVGCATAYFVWHYGRPFPASRMLLPLAALASLAIVVPLAFSKLEVNVPLKGTVQSIGIATLIVLSVLNSQRLATRWLQWRWLEYLGTISYSIYIWQQFFLSKPSAFGMESVWYLTFPACVPALLSVSAVSFLLIERPFLLLKNQLKNRLKKDTGTDVSGIATSRQMGMANKKTIHGI